MCTSSSVIYSDKESDKMKRRRKWDLVIGIFASILFSTIYTAFSVNLITLIIVDPLVPKIVPIVLVALSLPVVYWMTYQFAVRDARRALKHGVILTDETLLVPGREIPVDHILRVEIADFHSGSHFLAIGYLYETGKKKKTKAILMWPKSTEDIWELCNKVRDMKGWAHQEKIQMYGHWAWSQWKDVLKELASERKTPVRGIEE